MDKYPLNNLSKHWNGQHQSGSDAKLRVLAFKQSMQSSLDIVSDTFRWGCWGWGKPMPAVESKEKWGSTAMSPNFIQSLKCSKGSHFLLWIISLPLVDVQQTFNYWLTCDGHWISQLVTLVLLTYSFWCKIISLHRKLAPELWPMTPLGSSIGSRPSFWSLTPFSVRLSRSSL